MKHDKVKLSLITPPRNHGGFILSVYKSVCLSVCLSMNKITAERIHRFRRGAKKSYNGHLIRQLKTLGKKY